MPKSLLVPNLNRVSSRKSTAPTPPGPPCTVQTSVSALDEVEALNTSPDPLLNLSI